MCIGPGVILDSPALELMDQLRRDTQGKCGRALQEPSPQRAEGGGPTIHHDHSGVTPHLSPNWPERHRALSDHTATFLGE